MSTTTQILFNSPALHSLKRDQLVKLCKIHLLKASGKNRDLIERLQLHAKSLPPDDPLSIATRNNNPDAKPAADSEDETSSQSTETHASVPIDISRPSEQWEVVMDTIAEVDEETARGSRGASDRQVSEFGTTTSKASVTTSLRAIANSLGLKRNVSKSNETSSSSSLSGKDVVQSSSTLPTSEPNEGPEEPSTEPVPGQLNLQGFPAPSGGRLSLTQAPTTTTIRLVSNPNTNPELFLSPPKLKPFATSFDLVPGTPGGVGKLPIPVWPLSPGGTTRESLYPPVPTLEDFGSLIRRLSPRPAQYDNSDMDIDVDISRNLVVPLIHEPTPTKIHARFNTGATPKSTEKPSAEPIDIFSPAPKPQKASTRSRLGIPRSEPFVFGSPLPQHSTSNLQFRTAAQSVLDEMNKRLAEEGVEAVDANVLNNRPPSTDDSTEKQADNVPVRVGDMFNRIHQKEFDKMDSIASHYAAKRGAQSTVAQPILSKKRKSSLVVKERKLGVPTARHRPNGSRVASGVSVKTLPGAFGEEGDEEDVADGRLSKRPRVEREESDVPIVLEKVSMPPRPDPGEEARKQKEREAIRRRLEHNKAKRRSSMGRPSLGRAPAPKPARFGFLASARSLVQNVWNRGAGSKQSNIPVTKPVPNKEETKTIFNTADVKNGSCGAPPQTKRVPSGGSSSSVQRNTAGRAMPAPPVVSDGGAMPSRFWKSPTPLSSAPSSSVAANPRSSTIAGHGQSNNRVSSLVGFSSLGKKSGRSANANHASSMGAKFNAGSSTTNLEKHVVAMPRSRTTSTLMAPTASSLAKITSYSRIPVFVTPRNENATLGKVGGSSKQQSPLAQTSAAFQQLTNSPQSPTRPAKVFSQPLSPPPPPPMSLAAAATSIIGPTPKEKPLALKVTPKAKVLPGRRPRISRSKVIARLALQRAAGASSGSSLGARAGGATGMGRAGGGRVRSSTSASVAGKARQSYSGKKGNDMLMSAKKRVRQSEQARRRSRAVASEGSRMDVD